MTTTPPKPITIGPAAPRPPCDDAELRKLLVAMRRNLIAANKIAEKIEAMVEPEQRDSRAA